MKEQDSQVKCFLGNSIAFIKISLLGWVKKNVRLFSHFKYDVQFSHS